MRYTGFRYILSVFIFVMLLQFSCANAKQLLEDWQLLTSSTVKQGRYNHEAIAMNGYVYIIDGMYDMYLYRKTIERAKILPDGTLGQWTTVSVCSEDRYFFSAVTVGKWLYLIGGENTGVDANFRYSNVERAEIYPVQGTFSQWTIIRTLPFYIYKHAAVSYGKYIYLLGGFVWLGDNDGSVIAYNSNSVFRAEISPDGSISEFTAETAATQVVHEAGSAILYGDSIYLICGYANYETTVERARILPDGHLSAWTVLNHTQYPHFDSRCAIAQDTYLFMVAGGVTPVEYATVDPAGNLSAWQTANTTPIRPYGSTAVLAYPYIYLPAGWNSSAGNFLTDALYTRFMPTKIQPGQWEWYSKRNSEELRVKSEEETKR